MFSECPYVIKLKQGGILHYQGNSRDLHYLITRDFLVGWGHPGWSRWTCFPARRGEGSRLGYPGGTWQQYFTKGLSKEKMDLAAYRSVCGKLKGSGHKLKEGKFKLNIMKNFFPMKRIKQWYCLPREIIYLWCFQYQSGQALNNLVWAHIWPCLSRRLDKRPPEVSSILNYLVVLWFCGVSLHIQILETTWNSSNILKLR